MITDRDAIVEAVNLYAWALDGKDYDLLAETFAHDLDADYGVSRWSSLEDFQRDMARTHDRLGRTQHLIGNHHIAIQGDTATCRSYSIATLTRPGASGGDIYRVGARYEDELVRTDHGWRVQRRKARAIWSEGNPGVVAADD